MHPYFFMKDEFIPIYNRDASQKWDVSIGYRALVSNMPPLRRVYLDCNLIAEYNISDYESERIAIIYLLLNGVLKQNKMAEVWGLHKNTLNNYYTAYQKHGIKGLTKELYQSANLRNNSKGKVQKENRKRTDDIKMVQISIDEYLSRKSLPEVFETNTVENKEVTNELCDNNNKTLNIPSIKIDSRNEKQDEQDEEILETEIKVLESSCGGYILFTPFIRELFESVFESLQSITVGKFEKLKATILMLIFCVLMGYTCPEKLKSVRRKDIGILIEKEAAFCCKTYRQHLTMFSEKNVMETLKKELSKNFVKKGYVELGTIYIDGHFTPYYGNKKVFKGYSTQRRIAMPGLYQNWVNDRNGKPIIFRVNNSFVKFTAAIINGIKDIQEIMKECHIREPLIVVFDRGGYDSKLFCELDQMGVGFITWKKGHKDIDKALFTEIVSYVSRDGKTVEYKKYKNTIKIKNYRDDVEAIVIYDEKNDKQATIINNLKQVKISDKSDSIIVSNMDGRWVQENFFKEAKVKEDLDHQFGYEFEEPGEVGEMADYEVCNPEFHKVLTKKKSIEKRFNELLKRKGNMLNKFQTLKRKVSLEQFLAQKGNQKIIDEYQEVETELKLLKDQLKTIKPKLPYLENSVDDSKAIFKTHRISSILSIISAVYNIRKKFEEISKECFSDHRELAKFVIQITHTRAIIRITDKSIYYNLEKLETPCYQRAAEKLLLKINAMDMSSLICTNKNIIVNFQNEKAT